MLRIECVYCGVRDEEEFTFGGPAHVSRPEQPCNDIAWADYLFNRDNPKGVHHERWCHSFGCRRWFNVARDTVTHEVLSVYRMGQSKPDTNSRGEAAALRRAGVTAGSGEGAARLQGRFLDKGAER